MKNDESGIHIQLGRLMGQMQSLVDTMNTMAVSMTRLEDRLRSNEINTNTLTVKMSLISMVAGGFGSLAVTLVTKYLHL